MKKQLAVAIAMLFGTGMGIAHAADGTINFTGTVTADTCTVAVNDQTNPTLNLGTVNSNDLAAAGQTGPATNFTLNLTACPDTVTAASVTFSGNADTASGIFNNEATGDTAATNVGVELYDANQNQVKADAAYDATAYLKTANSTVSAAIPFTARIAALADGVTPGALVSHADYTITYP